MIQREVESRDIRTVSIVHLPKVAKKVRPPRMVYIKFPLGKTFYKAFETETQRKIVKDMLNFGISGGAEELIELKYKWKR